MHVLCSRHIHDVFLRRPLLSVCTVPAGQKGDEGGAVGGGGGWRGFLVFSPSLLDFPAAALIVRSSQAPARLNCRLHPSPSPSLPFPPAVREGRNRRREDSRRTHRVGWKNFVFSKTLLLIRPPPPSSPAGLMSTIQKVGGRREGGVPAPCVEFEEKIEVEGGDGMAAVARLSSACSRGGGGGGGGGGGFEYTSARSPPPRSYFEAHTKGNEEGEGPASPPHRPFLCLLLHLSGRGKREGPAKQRRRRG